MAAESVSLRQANTYDQNTEQEGEADEASSFEKQRMDIMQENSIKTLDVTKNERTNKNIF